MIILSIRLFFLAARETNPEGLPFFINPSVLTGTSPIFYDAKHPVRLRGTAREDCDTKNFLSQPKKVLVTLIYVICSFFSAARRTNQEAPPQLSGFWLVATVAVGVCGTRSAQTVLALFPPSSLRLRRQIKAESGIVAFACILTPSVLLTPPSFGHLPYILLCKTPRNAAGHGKGRG